MAMMMKARGGVGGAGLMMAMLLVVVAVAALLPGCGSSTSSGSASTEAVNEERVLVGTFGGVMGAGVDGEVFLHSVNTEAGTAVLVARFIPPPPDTSAYHLYSKDLPMEGVDGMGRPTLVEIPPSQPLRATGPITTPSQVADKQILDWVFPLYDAGPVELSLPIQLPQGDGSPREVTLWMSYMTCNDETCLRPVEREEAIVNLPTSAQGVEALEADAEGAATESPRAVTTAPQDIAVQAGQWHYPMSADELRAIMAAADAAGLPAFLDFTGPTCVNCQIMKRTVFETEPVLQSFADLVLISINTDPPHADLGAFQIEHYGTFTRPFYVRTNPQSDDPGQAWATFFRPNNQEQMQRFTTFLGGGPGDAPATLDAVADSVTSAGGWGGFLLLAVLGGLFTLVMPCTYPMIPLTINFFTKQGENGRSILPLAATYACGIILFFVAIGWLFAQLIGSNPAYFAGHWLTNLVIGLLFLVLGASLLGLFFLRLPAGFSNLGGGRSGYGGALIMGLAFAIISFTCTAPFAGLVLGSAMLTGVWSAAIIGMAVYATVIAVPFFFLSMSPGLLKRLPGAGAWMNEFKVAGGLIEIAAAFKFLYITDLYFGWGVVDRTSTLAVWTTISLVIAIYLAGKLRMDSDAPVVAIGPFRLLLIIGFTTLGFFFLAGLSGVHLGAIEGLFP